jgi:hypothetical protein
MDATWLSTREAAGRLGLTEAAVRRQVTAGDLAAVRLSSGNWLIDPADVHRRTGAPRRSGRPLSAPNAWRVLTLLDAADRHPEAPRQAASDRLAAMPLARWERQRLRGWLADLPAAADLALLLRARARRQRMRVHPGLAERVAADPRAIVGGDLAVAHQGGGLAAGHRLVIYVHGDVADSLISDYRMTRNAEGLVDLMILPLDAEASPYVPFRRPNGEPGIGAGMAFVPRAVAMVDLLADADVRARGVAEDWLASLPRPLVNLPSAA